MRAVRGLREHVPDASAHDRGAPEARGHDVERRRAHQRTPQAVSRGATSPYDRGEPRDAAVHARSSSVSREQRFDPSASSKCSTEPTSVMSWSVDSRSARTGSYERTRDLDLVPDAGHSTVRGTRPGRSGGRSRAGRRAAGALPSTPQADEARHRATPSIWRSLTNCTVRAPTRSTYGRYPPAGAGSALPQMPGPRRCS